MSKSQREAKHMRMSCMPFMRSKAQKVVQAPDYEDVRTKATTSDLPLK